jgi:hypothetical protein
MDPATIIALGTFLAKNLPTLIAAGESVVNAIKSLAGQFADDNNLDRETIVRAIAADQHELVDAQIDAELEAHAWPRP